jgi:hypothetical protein
MSGNNKELVIKVAGECMKVNKSDNVRETLKKILKDKGITVYGVTIDGKEIDANTVIPLTFQDIKTLEVRRLVTAGK